MFGNHQFDRVREIFADQFEPDGPDFLYRKSMKGPPIRVSEAEREAFLEDFKQRLRYLGWAIVPGTVLLIVLAVVFGPTGEGPSSNLPTYMVVGLVLGLFMIGYHWAWNAPARELVRRPELGKARSRAEMRRIMLARVTYGQLALGGGAMLALLFNVSGHTDLLHGWGRLWLALSAVAFAGLTFQAYRKWRFDNRSGG